MQSQALRLKAASDYEFRLYMVVEKTKLRVWREEFWQRPESTGQRAFLYPFLGQLWRGHAFLPKDSIALGTIISHLQCSNVFFFVRTIVCITFRCPVGARSRQNRYLACTFESISHKLSFCIEKNKRSLFNEEVSYCNMSDLLIGLTWKPALSVIRKQQETHKTLPNMKCDWWKNWRY